MASPNVLAELASRINTKDEGDSPDINSSPVESTDKKGNSIKKDGTKSGSEKEGGGKKFKRSKSRDFEKSPNHSKKKGKTKVQKVDSDSGGENSQKKGGFLSGLKKKFKKRDSGKQRKRSSEENQLKAKSRSENDLIGIDGSSNFRSVDGDSRHSWASGLDDAGLDDDKKEKKSGISSFFEKRIRESFRNRFKIKSRKTSLDKKGAIIDNKSSSFAAQRPVSDSNLYALSRDTDFFDDSFFTVSLTNDNESFTSQPESVTIGDLATLETSEIQTENNVARSKIQVAPKNRRKPTRFRGSKAMSDTTDNMASTSSLGMISEVTSDDDRKLSPDFTKEGEKADNETSSAGHGDRLSVDLETSGLKGTSSSLSSSANESGKFLDDTDNKTPERSNSLLAGLNGPAGELSRVLTASLSSLDRQKLNTRSSRERLGSRASLEKSGSKSSLHEFEIKRLSLRSTSSKELAEKPVESDSSLPDITKRESPRPDTNKVEIPSNDLVEHSIEEDEDVQHELIKPPIPAPRPNPPSAAIITEIEDTKLTEQETEAKDKVKKESRIPIHAKPQPPRPVVDSSTLSSNDVRDVSSDIKTIDDKRVKPVINGTKPSLIEAKGSRLPEPGFNLEHRSQPIVKPEPSPKLKGSALPVLDKSRLPQTSSSPSDDPDDPRDRTKSAASRLTTPPYRFVNKALSLDDDFRSNDEKGSINRSKSLNYDSKKLRFGNKALAEKDVAEVVNNGTVPEENKPDWVSIAQEKQRKRDSVELTESSGEEKENNKSPSPILSQASPALEKKPEIPKKPKGLKLPSPPVDKNTVNKEFVRTTRSLKIQSSAAPVVEVDLRGADSTMSGANCIVCGRISYMFGRLELDGQYIHKSCAKCSVCGTYVTAESITLKDKIIFCQLHGENE